ncbi:DgyrCDS9187 [Dimorphilus gyrociliatus]|uniref:DgyrCDS9187 n=1 Tax=Dimorphilus gyrociliatus TaxID=2664684 RepID=A0A7I8VYH9_9ANNE|nr:DgyrCDS9187 [Dimorphilus gyrociliatus]
MKKNGGEEHAHSFLVEKESKEKLVRLDEVQKVNSLDYNKKGTDLFGAWIPNSKIRLRKIELGLEKSSHRPQFRDLSQSFGYKRQKNIEVPFKHFKDSSNYIEQYRNDVTYTSYGIRQQPTFTHIRCSSQPLGSPTLPLLDSAEKSRLNSAGERRIPLNLTVQPGTPSNVISVRKPMGAASGVAAAAANITSNSSSHPPTTQATSSTTHSLLTKKTTSLQLQNRKNSARMKTFELISQSFDKQEGISTLIQQKPISHVEAYSPYKDEDLNYLDVSFATIAPSLPRFKMHKVSTHGDNSRHGTTFFSVPAAPTNSLPHINSDRPRALFGKERMKLTKMTGNGRKDFSRDAYEKILKQQTLLQTAVQIVLLEQVDRKAVSAGEFSGGIMQFLLTGYGTINQGERM